MEILLMFLSFSLLAVAGCQGQHSGITGVYGGLETSLSVVMGAGMSRTDHAFYFRPNGTFSDKLNKPDWKTNVDGTYHVQGSQVTVKYNGGGTDRYKIQDGGSSLGAGSYSLLKMSNTSTVPAGHYDFTMINSSGGGSSGLAAVSSSNQTGLDFDGKGHFSRNHSGAVSISGSNVGGGTSSRNGGDGTYALKDGILTLSYTDGRSEIHSFFSRPEEKPVMAVVDGNIYFMEDKKPAAGTHKAYTNQVSSTSPSAMPSAVSTASIIEKAHQAQGGAALDAIKTLQVSASISGVSVTVKTDLDAGKIRTELSSRGKLAVVEQVDGNTGWQWKDGKQQPLSDSRLQEMKHSMHTGILAFAQKNLSRLQMAKVQQGQNNMNLLTVKQDGGTDVFVIDSQGKLVADGSSLNNLKQMSVYADFQKVQGVLVPFQEVQTSGLNKMVIRYESYRINPGFTSADWAVPNQ